MSVFRELAESRTLGGHAHFDREALWTPQPKQLEVVNCEADIIGFAGEANSGKSDLLAFYPLYKDAGADAVLIREEFSTLDSLRNRISFVLRDYPEAVTQKFVNWPNGSRTTFGHIKQWADVRKHQGRARQYHLFDELGHLEEAWFRALLPWNRSPTGRPCHVVCATNPPFPDPYTGESKGEWLIDYFGPWVDDEYEGTPAESGEVRFYVRGFDSDEEVEKDMEVPDRTPVPRVDFGWTESDKDPLLIPRSRTFIHASMSDNAYATEDYRANLQGAHSAQREALLEGKWRRASGMGDEFGIAPAAWINAGVDRWREAVKEYGGLENLRRVSKLRAVGCDPSRGGNNSTVIMLLWELPDGRPFLDRAVRIPGRIMPDGGAVATAILETIAKTGCTREQLREWDTEIRVDAIGIGSAVIDALRGVAPCKWRALNGKNKSWKQPRGGAFHAVTIANARAEYYWGIREGLDPQFGINLCIPPDANLRKELRVTRWENTPQGLRIMEKDALRKILGRSPDTGDAASYAAGASKVSLSIAVA